MSADNLRHWSALERTDPDHTKQFNRPGGFRGTATRPIWHHRRMTEHFGPCGIGWGMDKPDFQTLAVEGEVLVYCTVRLWYRDGDHTGEVYGVGGDKAAFRRESRLIPDDEAFKKAFTDAIGNAMKHLGVGADVHMGLFEDSKYVKEAREEFDRAENGKPAPEPRPTAPTNNVREIALSQPARPDEPPDIAQERAARAKASDFWSRESYAIRPEHVGGIANWDGWYLRMAREAPDLASFRKLRDDNITYRDEWMQHARKDVIDAQQGELDTIDLRLHSARDKQQRKTA